MEKRGLLQAVFFTKDGELDFGWILLIGCYALGGFMLVMEATGKWQPSPWGWAYLGSFTVMNYIAGAAIGRARLIAKSSTVGDVAKGIASALPAGVRDPTLIDIREED